MSTAGPYGELDSSISLQASVPFYDANDFVNAKTIPKRNLY